jgi:PKD repeat protein/glucose/arabinose dehydrogenase
MPTSSSRLALPTWLAAAAIVLLCSPALANVPPAAPVITEPAPGRIQNPGDVHMECQPFSDADPGDTHLCTDWEIWTSPSPPALGERVWFSACIGGVERLHTHLGDGAFIGSHAGRNDLISGWTFVLRVRHRDSSGDPATEWSPWSVRVFETGPASQIFPLEGDDVADQPAPTWLAAVGEAPVILPAAATAPSLRLEHATGALLLEFHSEDGIDNHIVNPAGLSSHAPLRLRISAGSLAGGLALPESNLTFTSHEGTTYTLFLPALSVQPGAANDAYFWIASSGATYHATAAQTEPDFSSLARGTPTPWIALQPGYRVEVVASGFKLPINIAFVPEPDSAPDAPFYYVTELYGSIKVVLRNGTVLTYANNLLNFPPTGAFPGSGEQGVTGIVVDPVNGDVYASMLYSSVNGVENVPHYPKVVRFTSTDGGRTAATQTTILDMAGEAQGQSHQISSMSFGPDGALYVHMGDGFTASTGQNLSSFRGKILRINRNGTPHPSNPFYNPGDGITARDYVFAYGLRNPFGGVWRELDSSLYFVENGPSVDRLVKTVSGRNYLWNGSDASMSNFAIYNWAPASGPVNMAFIQPGTFGGSGFPPDKQGSAFVTESGGTWANGPQAIGKRITEFVLDALGNRISGPTTLVQYAGSGRATVCGLAAGPDGLYFTDLYKDLDYVWPTDAGANVLRIRFVGDASFNSSVVSGSAPLTVQFTDTSTVPGIVSWLWEFGDGTTSTEQNPSHTYTEDGLYTVRLSVTGSTGLSIEEKRSHIRVGVLPRVALVGVSLPATPADHAIAHHLEDLGFEVTAYDDEPANRPSAAQIAAASDLVIVSSTITSTNVGGEFRALPVPMIFWENALLRAGRESLTDNGTVLGATAINIINNVHPITQGFAAGARQVYTSTANMSVATGNIGPGTLTLARRDGSLDGAIVVAEAGATVADNYITPARRVFMFFEDASWQVATPDAKALMERAVCWALNIQSPGITTQPQSLEACEGESAMLSVTASGSSPISYQWRRNGQNINGATSRIFTIPAISAGSAGSYDCVVSNPCGQATSSAASITVTTCCPADFNNDGSVTVPDIFAFLSAWFAQSPAADFNDDLVVTVPDIFAYLAAWFAGC